MAVKVTRTREGGTHHNTFVVVPIKLIFQRWPGKSGSEGTRCIKGAAFSLLADGVEVTSGITPADGTVNIGITPRGQQVVVRIFGTDFQVTPLRAMPELKDIDTATMSDGDQNDDLVPITRRLEALGYNILSPSDGTMDVTVDHSILQFQVDAKIDVDSIAGPITRGKLKDQFGV